MKDIELNRIWKSYEEKLDEVLSLNKEIVTDITHKKLNRTINKMRPIKVFAVIIGIPFMLITYMLTFIGFKAEAIFVTLGFGCISVIMTTLIVSYLYQLYLIRRVSNSDEVIEVQKAIADLKIASFSTIRLAILQIPFWSICTMSYDAVLSSPMIYGGVNAAVFIGLSYLSFWIYQRLDFGKIENSRVTQFFLSGPEWEPIVKASSILDQLKEFK